jgi:hypothetical protein
MQTTAESGTVPTKSTVTARLADATGHRTDTLSAQYRRITGTTTSESDPDAICTDLSTWIRNNKPTIRTLVEDGTTTFEDVSLSSLNPIFETAWTGEQINEGDLAESAVRTEAETYEQIREIIDGDPSPWSQLQSAGKMLREEHPESPTTDSVTIVLNKSTPPSPHRVEQLIEESKNPRPPVTGDDAWAELQRVAETLREDLPHAEITDTVTDAVDGDERPEQVRTTELLSEATTILERVETIQAHMNKLDDGAVVRIDRSE